MADENMTEDVIQLPEVIDVNALEKLHPELLERRGGKLTLDATEVTSLGAQGLQFLLSAAQTWRADDKPFAMSNAGEDVVAAISMMGVDPSALTLEGDKHE